MSEGGLEQYLRLAAAGVVLVVWWGITRRGRRSAPVRAEVGERIVDFVFALVQAAVLLPVTAAPITGTSSENPVGFLLGLSVLVLTFFIGFTLLRSVGVHGISVNLEAGTLAVVMLALLILLIVAVLVLTAW